MNETTNNEATVIEETGAAEEKSGKFYTEEEIALLEQKAGDKRISQYQKTLEKKQRESERLRNMSAEDKREYDLAERERAIEAKEVEFRLLENKSECISILTDKGLDAKLVDFCVAEDADTMYDNIKKLEKIFKANVKAEVEKRLGGASPKVAPMPELSSITKKDIANMPLSQLQALMNENPELFSK